MRRLGLLTVLAFALSAGPASAADELIETITVPAVTKVEGKVALAQGTRYTLEVTGTMDSTGPEGYGYQYDAMYCVHGIGFDHPECETKRQDPKNHESRSAGFEIGAGADDRWATIDRFSSSSAPYTDTSLVVDYNAAHQYSVPFVAPASAPLRAGFSMAIHPCSGCQGTTTGSFTVKVFGPAAAPAPSPSASPSPAGTAKPCVSAAQVAFASTICLGAVGDIFSKPAPQPGKPTEVGIQIPPDVQQIFLDAGIENAATQQLIATLIVNARIARLHDQLRGCVEFNTSTGDDKFAVSEAPDKLAALVVACQVLIVKEAEKAAQNGGARMAAAGKCSVHFHPVYKRGHVPSRKRRRAIGKAAKKAFTGTCASEGGRLTLSVTSRRKGVPLAKLTGRKLGASVVRVAPKGAPTPADARLNFRWRKP
jgi:hypothetical protein